MKYYSFVAQAANTPQVAHNAAPMAPFNPFAAHLQAVPPAAPKLQVLDRDAFSRTDTESRRQPVVPSFAAAHRWLCEHTALEAQERLDNHLTQGSYDHLREAVGLLNAANRGQMLQFGETDNARFDFHRHYGEAVEALTHQDIPAARMSLQRANRCLVGFRNRTSD